MDKFDQKRLDSLEEQIEELINLINEIDSIINTESDTLIRAKYEKQVRRLKGRLQELQDEYAKLKSKATSAQQTHMALIAARLDSIDHRLERLSGDVVGLRWSILDRFDEAERKVISSVVTRLSAEQLQATDQILAAIEDRNIDQSEMKEYLAQLQEVLANILQTLDEESHPVLDYQIKNAVKIVNDTILDVKNKLKATIPIIPFVLSYETELTLESSANITALWARAVKWLRGT